MFSDRMQYNQSYTSILANTTDNFTNNEKLSTIPYNAIAVIISIAGILSFLENVMVVLLFIKTKYLRTPMNIFIVALGILDIFPVFISYPAVVFSSIQQRWAFGIIGCEVEGFSVSVIGFSSIFILTAIAVQRNIAIHNYREYITCRSSIISVLICCSLGLTWAAMPFIGWGSFAVEGCGISCAPNWRGETISDVTYNWAILVMCFIIPLAVFTLMYISITRKIKHISKTSMLSRETPIARKKRRLEAKLMKTVVVLLGAFLLSWSPYATVSCLALFGYNDMISPILTTIPSIFAKLSGMWNPIIYAATHSQFRTAFINNIPCSKLQRILQNKFNKEASEDTEEKVMKKYERLVKAKTLRTVDIGKKLKTSEVSDTANKNIEQTSSKESAL